MNKSSSPYEKLPVGKLGEQLAFSFLENKNYTILEKNYRFGRGEIDIIAEDDNMLVFIEVKTKKFGDFGDPITWVPRSKQRQIGTVAKGYLYEKNITNQDCRFDVLENTVRFGILSLVMPPCSLLGI